MATDLSGSNYSETDASNNNAAPNGMPEGMAPSGVNDAWRQGMGAVKRAYDRDHGGTWCTVGGTANAITLTYTTGPASYVQGEKFAFKATAANTGATTVNVSTLGVKNIFRKGVAAPVALSGGEINTGDIVEIEYDGTQFQITSAISGFGAITNSIAGDVALNSTGTYFTGPTVAQGTVGTWFASGTVSLVDNAGAASFHVKLWDGTTVIASANAESAFAVGPISVSLSGFLTSPAGNIRISVKDASSTSGLILASATGNAKDSTITAIRIG